MVDANIQRKIKLFHRTVEGLRKKVKVKRISPLLTKEEKESVAREHFGKLIR